MQQHVLWLILGGVVLFAAGCSVSPAGRQPGGLGHRVRALVLVATSLALASPAAIFAWPWAGGVQVLALWAGALVAVAWPRKAETGPCRLGTPMLLSAAGMVLAAGNLGEGRYLLTAGAAAVSLCLVVAGGLLTWAAVLPGLLRRHYGDVAVWVLANLLVSPAALLSLAAAWSPWLALRGIWCLLAWPVAGSLVALSWLLAAHLGRAWRPAWWLWRGTVAANGLLMAVTLLRAARVVRLDPTWFFAAALVPLLGLGLLTIWQAAGRGDRRRKEG